MAPRSVFLTIVLASAYYDANAWYASQGRGSGDMPPGSCPCSPTLQLCALRRVTSPPFNFLHYKMELMMPGPTDSQ